MLIIVALVIRIGISFAAASMARRKHRNVVRYYVCGFLFPILTLIVAACVSPIPAPDQRIAEAEEVFG